MPAVTDYRYDINVTIPEFFGELYAMSGGDDEFFIVNGTTAKLLKSSRSGKVDLQKDKKRELV